MAEVVAKTVSTCHRIQKSALVLDTGTRSNIASAITTCAIEISRSGTGISIFNGAT
jgi:hypothetical protein